MSIKRLSLIIYIFLPIILFVASFLLPEPTYKKGPLAQKVLGPLANTSTPSEEFTQFLENKKSLPREKEGITLIAVGDISYSRGVERIVKAKKDINYPFQKSFDYFNSADFVFGNLETPITEGEEIQDLVMNFRSNPDTADALKSAGFSIVSLANNHTPNFDEKGLNDTFQYLEKAGIKYVGAGKNSEEAYQPVYLEKKDIQLAFLAYTADDLVPASYEATTDDTGKKIPGTAFMRIDKMTTAITEAKKKADFVIISMHAGIEYKDTPSDKQVAFAHAAIDAGADLVIGHHPHVVQTMEKYKEKYIFYSLGNFVFDQMFSEETKESLVLKIYLSKDNLNKINITPMYMTKFAQPESASEKIAEKIIERLNYSLEKKNTYSWDKKQNNFTETARDILYENKAKVNYNISKQLAGDLNKNSELEYYSLENGVFKVEENSKTIWQSPNGWWIDNFQLADSTNDGITDINLSLWKSGDYGMYKPIWEDKNDSSVKNHFFVLNYKEDGIKEVWASSNLDQPNCEFLISDVDDDGKNDLIAIEGDYDQDNSCEGKHVAVWVWNDWGFHNKWRSNKGEYTNLEIETLSVKKSILIDSY